MAQDVDVNEKSSILGKRDLKDMKNDDSSESSDLEILTVPKKKRHRIESIQSEKDSTTTSTNQNINTKTVTGSEDRISTAKAKKKLIKLLRDIKQPIEVSVGGIAKNVPSVPLLYISEIGLIPLPLNEYTINQLLQKMKTSSFGRHLWTETDESIRKSYELTADQFECKNPNFDISIQKLAKSTGKLMGVDDEYVVAVPYKLILYEPGSHFVEHRDTEKLEGMFGTLVIQLPSIYTVENGLPVLSVKHLDTEFEYHFGAEEKCDFPPSAANIFYAANHADLRHTVNKIESGHRLILTYNLIISDGKQQPKIPYGEELNGKLRSVLTKWDGSAPLMMLLEHLYTEKSMNDRGMDALKGRDLGTLRAMMRADPGKKIRFCVALLQKDEESTGGAPPGTDYYGYNDWNVASESTTIDKFWVLRNPDLSKMSHLVSHGLYRRAKANDGHKGKWKQLEAPFMRDI